MLDVRLSDVRRIFIFQTSVHRTVHRTFSAFLIIFIPADGIMAFYPTQLLFQYTNPHMRKGMLGDIIQKCHAQGIYVIVLFDFSRVHKSILLIRVSRGGVSEWRSLFFAAPPHRCVRREKPNLKIYICNMINKIIFSICFLSLSFLSFAQEKTKPVSIIFDSDMGPDYDDVGAITLLHAFADSGQVKILATIASTKYEGVAGVFNVLNTYFNRPGIPVGVPKGKALELKDRQHWTDSLLFNYPHTIKKNDEAPDAVSVYRKTLASQPDHSVTIITVGFLTNLADLLKSSPDKFSKLDGKQLVKKKVKQLVCMAGRFPVGSEFNVRMDAAASKYVFDNWQTPVLLSGVEIGLRIKTGLPLIHNENIQKSPVKDVFRICIPQDINDTAGRMSWDETAVLVAVKGYAPWYEVKKGKMIVDAEGSDTWSTESSMHAYLVEKLSPVVVAKLINSLIMHQPIIRK
jgi:pyrimidine-specific ribonucleoside hydrolase